MMVSPPAPRPTDVRIAELRARCHGRRLLLATNRSGPALAARLAEQLGVRCEIVTSANSPRRRQAALARIRRGRYDIVLVAHGFTGHADTEQLGPACNHAGALFCRVDRGGLGQIVDALWRHRDHARIAP